MFWNEYALRCNLVHFETLFEKCYCVCTDLVASGWFFRYSYLYIVMMTIFWRGSWAFLPGSFYPPNTLDRTLAIVQTSNMNSSLNLKTILWCHFYQWLCVSMIDFTQLSTFNNPCRNKSFNFGCMTKFFPPPATEMTSLGNSNFHSSCKRRRTSSASVSSEIRMN